MLTLSLHFLAAPSALSGSALPSLAEPSILGSDSELKIQPLTYSGVHIRYTVPIAILLLYFARPLFKSADKITLIFLLTCALFYTTPWDNHIISHGAWSYPAGRATSAPIGFIPLEEYAFFIIQTAITGIFVLLVTKHLPASSSQKRNPSFLVKNVPLLLAVAATLWGWTSAIPATKTFYLGSILWWVMPVLCFQWWLAGPYIWRNLWHATIAIAIPTLYLCWVDHVALGEEVWTISHGTSMGWMVTRNLPFEEALFFFLTNCMVVFGTLTAQRTHSVAVKRKNSLNQKADHIPPFSVYIRAMLASDSEVPVPQHSHKQ